MNKRKSFRRRQGVLGVSLFYGAKLISCSCEIKFKLSFGHFCEMSIKKRTLYPDRQDCYSERVGLCFC